MAHRSQHDEDQSTSGPTSLLAFVRAFPDEETCLLHLFSVRWPDGFMCPKCSVTKGWMLHERRVVECSNGHQTSLTAGTVMHGTRMPLQTWFCGAYLVSTLTPGVSAVQFQKQLGLSRYETAFQMLHKLRAGLVDPERDHLHGVVEVDEAFVGGVQRGGRPGRGSTNALVVVGVEVITYEDKRGQQRSRAGRIRATHVSDASSETLYAWLEHNVEHGSLVVTDGWSGYNGIRDLGYRHSRQLQSVDGEPTGEYLALVHLIISNLKRWLLGTHKGAVSDKHLQSYLNEFVFRFNRRFWRGNAFERAMGLAVDSGGPTYEELYNAGADDGWMHPNPDEQE